jgi:hypothetical protein
MKKFCILVILSLSLSFSAYADCTDDGHVGCPGVTITGSQQTPPSVVESELTELAVSLIQSVLALS